MAVRVRLKLKSRISGEVVETVALVNTGFETESPQLLIPLALARRLSLHPPPPTATIAELGTAGGPVRMFIVRDALEVWVVAGDRSVGPRVADALISGVEEEVLINDKLMEELGIVVVAAGSGKWRFIDDPVDRIRVTEKPQYWS
jgi:hypothetical protein